MPLTHFHEMDGLGSFAVVADAQRDNGPATGFKSLAAVRRPMRLFPGIHAARKWLSARSTARRRALERAEDQILWRKRSKADPLRRGKSQGVQKMRANLGPPVSLDFLDGYLFRLLQEIASKHGLEQSGFENYYGSRIREKIGGLIEYEESLAGYLLEGYPGRRVVHAGIGIGTLACALACNGMTVAGVEYYPRRVASARLLRAALIEIWPEVEARYEIIEGTYPQALMPSTAPTPAPQPSRFFLPWRRRPEKSALPAESGLAGSLFDSNSLLIFTNVASGWDELALVSIIKTMPRFAAVILDLRLFGSDREDEHDRVALFDRIAAMARSAERLPQLAGGSHFARFVFA